VNNKSEHATFRGALLHPTNRAFSQHRSSTQYSSLTDADIDNVLPDAPTVLFPYGSNAYIISSEAARSLENLVARYGFRRPANEMLAKLMATVRTYTTTPLLAFEADPEGDDSDVRFDYTRLPEPGIPAEISLMRPPGQRLPLPPLNTLASGTLLPAFVINLNSSQARMATFAQHAKEIGLRYKRFDAVDGTTLQFPQLVSSGILSADFDTAHAGTAGQALSHLMVLESIAGGSFDAALILEDDVALNQGFLDSISYGLSVLPKDWHVYALDCPSSCKPGTLQPGIIVAGNKCAPSLHAYIVSRAGVDAILDRVLPLRGPLASDLAELSPVTLKVACAYPKVATENDLGSDR